MVFFLLLFRNVLQNHSFDSFHDLVLHLRLNIHIVKAITGSCNDSSSKLFLGNGNLIKNIQSQLLIQVPDINRRQRSKFCVQFFVHKSVVIENVVDKCIPQVGKVFSLKHLTVDRRFGHVRSVGSEKCIFLRGILVSMKEKNTLMEIVDLFLLERKLVEIWELFTIFVKETNTWKDLLILNNFFQVMAKKTIWLGQILKLNEEVSQITKDFLCLLKLVIQKHVDEDVTSNHELVLEFLDLVLRLPLALQGLHDFFFYFYYIKLHTTQHQRPKLVRNSLNQLEDKVVRIQRRLIILQIWI